MSSLSLSCHSFWPLSFNNERAFYSYQQRELVVFLSRITVKYISLFLSNQTQTETLCEQWMLASTEKECTTEKKNNAVEYIKKSGTCSSRQCTHSVWWRNKGGKSQADIAFEKGYVNFESPDWSYTTLITIKSRIKDCLGIRLILGFAWCAPMDFSFSFRLNGRSLVRKMYMYHRSEIVNFAEGQTSVEVTDQTLIEVKL